MDDPNVVQAQTISSAEEVAAWLETLQPDVAQDLDPSNDAVVPTYAIQLVPIDDHNFEDDQALFRRLQSSISSLSATGAQQLLRRHASLVSSNLVSSHSTIHVEIDGSCGMHFLDHQKRETGRPLFNINGPRSGQLHAADETSFPGSAMLKVSATANAKAMKDGIVTDAHKKVAVTAWREVSIGPKHGNTSTSIGSIRELSSVRAPEHGQDFNDMEPKVSLIVFTPRSSSPSAHKRPALSVAAKASTSADTNKEDASFRKLVVDELFIGGVDLMKELTALKEQVLKMRRTQRVQITPNERPAQPSAASTSTGVAGVDTTFRRVNADDLVVDGVSVSQELAIMQHHMASQGQDHSRIDALSSLPVESAENSEDEIPLRRPKR